MNNLLLQLGMIVVVLALALLMAAPAPAQNLTLDALQPDAALLAQSGSGATVDGASWQVVSVEGCRGWLDIIDPRDNWGVGISADLSPGGAACVGGGWREGFVFYYGIHF
jgi:hypothetical protein